MKNLPLLVKPLMPAKKKLNKDLKKYQFAGGYYTRVQRNYNVSDVPDDSGNFIELENDDWDGDRG